MIKNSPMELYAIEIKYNKLNIIVQDILYELKTIKYITQKNTNRPLCTRLVMQFQ